MYTQIQSVSNEYMIHNIDINEAEQKAYFYDVNNKRHGLKLKVDNLGRYYIIFKNRHIYFLTMQRDGNLSLIPAYRNNDKIISPGFRVYAYNTRNNMDFYCK